MNAKPFFVVLVFLLFLIILAGGAVGETNLTRSAAPVNTANQVAGLEAAAPASGPMLIGQVQRQVQGQSQAAGVCGSVYTVVAGDTLTCIAKKCNTTLPSLLAANPAITDPDVIKAGQQLVIYGVASVPAQAPATDAPVPTSAQPTIPVATLEPTAQAPLPEPGYPAAPTADPAAGMLPIVTQPAGSSGELQGLMNNLAGSSAAVPNVGDAAVPVKVTAVGDGGFRPGSRLAVEAAGFQPGAAVEISIGAAGFGGEPVGRGQADQQGVYRGEASIPSLAPAGVKYVVTVQTTGEPVTKMTSPPFVIQP